MKSPRLPSGLPSVHDLLAAASYFAASVVLTWPLAARPGAVLFGDCGDARGAVWWIWAHGRGFLAGAVNPLIAAPYGAANAVVVRQPVGELLMTLFARFSNEVAAYNFFVLLAFPLTALATYVLLDRLFRNKVAAFVGGLIFGFCPAAVTQAAGGHPLFAFNVFIPFFVGALLLNRSRRTLWTALLVAASFAGVTLTALYFGYFCVFVGLSFAAFDLVSARAGERRAVLANYATAAFFAAGMLVPFTYEAFHRQATASGAALAGTGQVREFEQLAVYAARFWSYFIPSIDHPVLGRYVLNFARNHLGGANIYEETLYLGFAPAGLLLLGFFLFDGKNPGGKKYFMLFASGVLLMLFFAMPPLLPVGKRALPTASYFAYKVAPMFRVYARFGIFANFFLACGAAAVLAELARRLGRARYACLAGAALCCVVFEYWTVPFGFAAPVDEPPAVYRWLAGQPGDLIVAEYPMMRRDEAGFYTYKFWQRAHGKRIVNGAGPENPEAWDFYERVNDLSRPETTVLLRRAGVKYVIVHNRTYREGEIPDAAKRYYPPETAARQYNEGVTPENPELKEPLVVFGSDDVYAL